MPLSPADITQITNLITSQLAAARIKISALPATGAISREAVFPIVNSGSTEKLSLYQLLGLGIATVSIGQELRAMDTDTLEDETAFLVLGVNTPGDGGWGIWRYDAASVATDNIGTVIAPDTGVGRFLREYSGSVNVRWFEATGDGSTDDTTACQRAIDLAVAEFLEVYFPAGTYSVTGLSVQGSDVSLRGDGSSVTTIKQRAGAATFGVFELGDLAAGNSATAYEKVSAIGMTIDGNKAAVSQPATDLQRWGITLTKISHGFFSDLRCINCWNGGMGVLINSNYNVGVVYVENCGEGYTGPVHEPGFDINSSKWNQFTVTSKDCYDGARILDNCWGNKFTAVIENATSTGFIYNNQLVNESYGNEIRLNVRGGCTGQAMSIGANCRGSEIHAVIDGVSGLGVYEIDGIASPNTPEANHYFVTTRGCGGSSCKIGGVGGVWEIISDKDGIDGAQGDWFAVEVMAGGNYNKIALNLTDSSTWQVRGIVFRNDADFNTVTSYNFNNRTTGDPWNDGGGGVGNVLMTSGQGTDIASAASISIPIIGDAFLVTGTTGINTIVAIRKGKFTLRFNNTLTVTAGSNLKMAGGANFSATADDTIEFESDGTTCYETSRSNNA